MITLLEKLKESLEDVFKSELKTSEIKLDENQEIDVFKTYLTLSKTAYGFRKLIEMSALPIDDLYTEFGSLIEKAIKSNIVSKGGAINNNKVFINSKGLYKFYLENELNLENVFEAYDEYKFPTEELVIKRQEKILSLFLVLMGADSEENRLVTKDADNELLTRYHQFLISIDNKIKENDLSIGKEFDWDTGKKVSFR